jgi:thiamine-phosphate pyrophosphorylase
MPSLAHAWPQRGLYLLTPDLIDTGLLCTRVEAGLRGGAVLLQYRNKHADASTRSELAHALRPICDRHRVPLLINDDAVLARDVGAAGVHLGEGDVALSQARALLGPDAVIGASCYDDLERAVAAAAAGASYLAFGAFFSSTTKPTARRAHPDLLRDAAGLGLPLVAIGGISADNARPLIDAGAAFLAVIGDVFDAPDIEAAARRYASLFQD